MVPGDWLTVVRAALRVAKPQSSWDRQVWAEVELPEVKGAGWKVPWASARSPQELGRSPAAPGADSEKGRSHHMGSAEAGGRGLGRGAGGCAGLGALASGLAEPRSDLCKLSSPATSHLHILGGR